MLTDDGWKWHARKQIECLAAAGIRKAVRGRCGSTETARIYKKALSDCIEAVMYDPRPPVI